MQQVILPECVNNDLKKFISTYYSKQLTHPLLIAQAFCLKFQEYGKQYNLLIIVNAIENIINNNHYL
jgi:hypothetical protein